MTDPTSKHAWPLKQYDGNREGYEEYEVDKDAWLIDKGYDKHPTQTEKLETGSKAKEERGVPPTKNKRRLQGVCKNATRRSRTKGKKSIWQ